MQIQKNKATRFAHECAYCAVFVALVIAVQVAFSAVPGVELVTVSFVAYAFTMGAKRGTMAATAFTFLRQFVFGFDPKVLVLYLVYYNLLSLTFGLLGKKTHNFPKAIVWITVLSCVGTVLFTLIDNCITPIWYQMNEQAARLYFRASLPFVIPQTVCTAVTVAILFYPMHRALLFAKKALK